MKTTKLKSGTYYIKGRKWWDKINGNTYNNAKVLDENMNILHITGYEYGYGSQYYYNAEKWIKANTRKNAKIKIIDLGAEYDKKVNVKNAYF